MHATVNTWIWAMGLLLQTSLLLALLWRGAGRVLPFFSMLIGFYAVRSAVLFLISGHLSRAGMGRVYDGLAGVDLLLQMLVVAELVHTIVRARGGWTIYRGGLMALAVGLAAAGGWTAGRLWMTRGRVSVDRWQMGLALLFVLVCAWAVGVRSSGLARRVLEGFALYSAVHVVADVERYRSALARDASGYLGWSYALAGVYLVVVAFWLAVVLRAGTRANMGVIPYRQAQGLDGSEELRAPELHEGAAFDT